MGPAFWKPEVYFQEDKHGRLYNRMLGLRILVQRISLKPTGTTALDQSHVPSSTNYSRIYGLVSSALEDE
jgi:hypothetical protein